MFDLMGRHDMSWIVVVRRRDVLHRLRLEERIRGRCVDSTRESCGTLRMRRGVVCIRVQIRTRFRVPGFLRDFSLSIADRPSDRCRRGGFRLRVSFRLLVPTLLPRLVFVLVRITRLV